MTFPIPTICCGTRFGKAYLEGIRRSSDFVLSGILARGSIRSKEMALKYGVPLYTSVDQIPQNIKAACVVIRSSFVGGAGTEIALSLLRRGIHVIQEHPIHPRELILCQNTAKENECVYIFNTHHVYLSHVQKFIKIIHGIIEEQNINFIHGVCGVQVVCSLLDIIGGILNKVTPYEFEEYKYISQNILKKYGAKVFPYEIIRGYVANIPTILEIQNYYDASDPDNNASILHRLTVGFPSGNLTLMSAAGPIIWFDRLHFPDDIFNIEGLKNSTISSYKIFSKHNGVSLERLVGHEWPQAVEYALRKFYLLIEGKASLSEQNFYSQTVCNLWIDIMQRLGAPQLVSLTPPPTNIPKVLLEYPETLQLY